MLAGCSKQPATDEPQPAATTETAAPTTTAGDTTVTKKYDPEKTCLTCAAQGDPMEGEELPEKVEYKGQTYRFCSEKCKADFISDPPKYAALSSR
jgi:YHS domain-containing protein